MSETPNESTSKEVKKASAPRQVKYTAVKAAYLKKRGIKVGTEEAFNAYKSLRQFTRANRVKLIKAGWKNLAKHQHGEPYDGYPMPNKVANMLVNRKIGK